MSRYSETSLQASASPGLVNWPTQLRASGEPGMWVMAMVESDWTIEHSNPNNLGTPVFERCHVDSLAHVSQPNVLVETSPRAGAGRLICAQCGRKNYFEKRFNLPPGDGEGFDETCRCGESLQQSSFGQDFPLADRFWPEEPNGDKASYSVQLLAAVCLGTSGEVYMMPADSPRPYWHCQATDLTADGQQLIATLERLYSRPVHLLTFIDT